MDGVGFAVVILDNCYKRRIPNEASIFSAELYAILYALQQIYIMNQSSYVIISDSQSALMALETYFSPHPLVIEIQEWLCMIYALNKTVKFCWVPSHIGVPSNELADREAKAAIKVV